MIHPALVSGRNSENAVKSAQSGRVLNRGVIIFRMNSKQMKRWLEQQGATFLPGKGSHLKVSLNGKRSSLPMHGTVELGKGLESAIKRQLGLK
jgi:mRNA interferase HicA